MSSPRYEPKLDRSCFLIASTLNEDMICATKEILLLAVLEGLLWMTHRRVDGRVLQAPRLLACGHINDQCDSHALHHAYSDFQIRKRDANFANIARCIGSWCLGPTPVCWCEQGIRGHLILLLYVISLKEYLTLSSRWPSRHLLATAAVRGVAWLNIICSVSKFLVIPKLSEPYISIQSSQHLTGINLMGKENLSDVALYNSRKSTASNSIH